MRGISVRFFEMADKSIYITCLPFLLQVNLYLYFPLGGDGVGISGADIPIHSGYMQQYNSNTYIHTHIHRGGVQ